MRSMRTIGGGEWFGKAWTGGKSLSYIAVLHTLTRNLPGGGSQMPKVAYKSPSPVFSKVEKPVGVVKLRKLRIKKDGGSAATGTPAEPGRLPLPLAKKGRKFKALAPKPVAVDTEMTAYASD